MHQKGKVGAPPQWGAPSQNMYRKGRAPWVSLEVNPAHCRHHAALCTGGPDDPRSVVHPLRVIDIQTWNEMRMFSIGRCSYVPILLLHVFWWNEMLLVTVADVTHKMNKSCTFSSEARLADPPASRPSAHCGPLQLPSLSGKSQSAFLIEGKAHQIIFQSLEFRCI